MNFLQKLESHTGGLLRLKSELFWYGGRGFDGSPGRVCLILDAVSTPVFETFLDAEPLPRAGTTVAAALLLIDGCPQWIWVGKEDVELIT